MLSTVELASTLNAIPISVKDTTNSLFEDWLVVNCITNTPRIGNNDYKKHKTHLIHALYLAHYLEIYGDLTRQSQVFVHQSKPQLF